MAPRLKYVDPTRPLGRFSHAYAAFSATRLGRFLSARVAWKVDPYLLRATRGCVGLGLGLPTALLETRGAKSGAVRRNAVVYFHDSDRVKIVGSKAGAETHPAWFHNLLAHPDVVFGGVPMRAAVVADETERRRLWALADRVFPPFATYRREAAKAHRRVPIVQLTAREPDTVVWRSSHTSGSAQERHDTGLEMDLCHKNTARFVLVVGTLRSATLDTWRIAQGPRARDAGRRTWEHSPRI